MTLVYWNYTPEELAFIVLIFLGLFVTSISLWIAVDWFIEMKRSADRDRENHQP